MTRLAFRLLCSQSGAQFCLQAAEIGASSKTVELASSSFYVDDFLTSVSSSAELLSLYSEVRALLSAEGFNLTKFCTNYPKVREVLPPGDASLSAKKIILKREIIKRRRLGVFNGTLLRILFLFL